MTNIARELTRARHDNYVQCCEGSKKLETIAVAFRSADSVTLGRLLTALTEYRHNRANTSSQSPLFAYWVWGGLTKQQENSLAVDLHREEVLMGIAFIACETFLVSKQEGN